MDASDYVKQLQSAADQARESGDERYDRKQAVADFSSMIYQQCNGQSLEAVFFAMPLMVEVIHSTLAQYEEDDSEPISEEERQYLLAVKMGMVECISHLNQITVKPAPKRLSTGKSIEDMTDQEIADALRKLDDSFKSDA